MKHVDTATERARFAHARMLEGQRKAAKVICEFIAEDAQRARLKRADAINAQAMRDFRARLGYDT